VRGRGGCVMNGTDFPSGGNAFVNTDMKISELLLGKVRPVKRLRPLRRLRSLRAASSISPIAHDIPTIIDHRGACRGRGREPLWVVHTTRSAGGWPLTIYRTAPFRRNAVRNREAFRRPQTPRYRASRCRSLNT